MSAEFALAIVLVAALAAVALPAFIERRRAKRDELERRAQLWDRYAAVIGSEPRAIEVLELAELTREDPDAFRPARSARPVYAEKGSPSTVGRSEVLLEEVSRGELTQVIPLTRFGRRQAD